MQTASGQIVRFLPPSLPADGDTLRANVRHALGLGLPELRDFEYPRGESLNVVANGPSALQAPLVGPTVAVNGALKLFTDRGLAPTYWIACDPQELVVDFLGDDPPQETVYLVASKCHPSVFERLRNHKVVLWHLSELATRPVIEDRLAVVPFRSVTTSGFGVYACLGWRDFHAWGWDCCALGGVENAVEQANGDMHKINVNFNGRDFKTTGTWAAEAQDALAMLMGFPFPVTFHGPGMMGAYAAQHLPMKIKVEG